MSDDTQPSISKKESEIFNAPDADLTIESCDNVIFRVHRKYLEAAAGAFPPSEIEAREEEIVSLTEDSETLTILFQFIYPRRNPEIDVLSFEPLYRLAEAAEKYEVFSAMDVCKRCFGQVILKPPRISVSY
ncbi:hypothetical protein H0H93_004357 [Arthromyces matolae]|nr:hypothetical protein H0H93_004357 [Arthromyces matolae]